MKNVIQLKRAQIGVLYEFDGHKQGLLVSNKLFGISTSTPYFSYFNKNM